MIIIIVLIRPGAEIQNTGQKQLNINNCDRNFNHLRNYISTVGLDEQKAYPLSPYRFPHKGRDRGDNGDSRHSL